MSPSGRLVYIYTTLLILFIFFNRAKYLVSMSDCKIYRILLDHVEYLLCSVEPNIMIWNCHRLKCHLLGVLKVGVRPPDLIEPFYR